MRMYGMKREDEDTPVLRKGCYGRYGSSKRHRLAYIRSERAIKRRARNEAKEVIRSEIVEA